MVALFNSLLGIFGLVWISREWGWTHGEILLSVSAANLSGLLALWGTLALERQSFFRGFRKALSDQFAFLPPWLQTWAVLWTIALSLQGLCLEALARLGLVSPDLLSLERFVLALPFWILSAGLMFPLFGLIQDATVRRLAAAALANRQK